MHEDPRRAAAYGELGFRVTEAPDLPWVLELEARPDVAPFITPWPLLEHEDARRSTDWAHLIVVRLDTAEPLGFVLLSGIETPDVCFHRLVVSQPGKGVGRWALRRVKALAFGTWGARRLWLDVFDFNERALGLYRSEGFQRTGIRSGSEAGGPPGSSLHVMEITAAGPSGGLG